MGATDSFREINLVCLSVISLTRSIGRSLQSYHSPNFAGKLTAPGFSKASSHQASARSDARLAVRPSGIALAGVLFQPRTIQDLNSAPFVVECARHLQDAATGV
jgi:hypothetical protein